ncbi:MAG TPA: 2-amino-4-hydroxy-6-hydroxymethyldihydropteridine diphosphokinase [Thermoanaerobaculia bacterium]|nr:2-amino-4-hydroxy-6-hydroxymethyldihydropteridine diphosphokinase [Thermoanaerobaculia bacterium]
MNTLSPHSVLIALGSNLGDRLVNLRVAVDRLGSIVRVVRLSAVWETDPVDAPRGSGPFLNMVAAGWTRESAEGLLESLHRIEAEIGRVRREKNEPRLIDLDLIFYGAVVSDERSLALPHPRYRERAFVLDPLRELRLPWVDPRTGARLATLRAEGEGTRKRALY